MSSPGAPHPSTSDAPTVQIPAVPPAATPPRTSRRRVFIGAAVAAVVLVAAGGVALYGFAGDVPRGTTVLGIDIGAKSKADAAKALRVGLAGRLDTAVPVRLGDKTVEISPAEVGLAMDIDATVAAAADGGWHMFGSRTVKPVVTVDAERLDAALRDDLGKDAQAMRMPAITFEGTTPKPVYPKPGTGLEPEKTAQAVREGWLGTYPLTVPIVEVHPATTAEEVDKLVADLATPAVSGPVTVTTNRGTVTVLPAEIAKSLVLTADKTGKITPRIDEKKLRAAIAKPLAKVEVKAKDATVAIVAGKPKVTAGTAGHEVDTAALSRDLLGVLPKTDGRTVAATMKDSAPKTTDADIAKLGIKERVSTFTTKFTGGLSSPRSQNIVLASKQVDGALVKPGETFSLNGHTGMRGYADGYKDAPTIVGGKLVPGVGGGVSQFTTTLFNASYYAGLKDVEHKPHSYYFSRYPAVIESTIFWPDLDFKFRNDSPYGVVIDTSYTSNSITVSMWSTKVYESVKTEWSPRRNITKPRTVYLDPGPSCIEASGSDGFTQDAYRVFRKGGKEVKREKFSWTYQAEPRFICAKKPAGE
ncbi:VanW family protein [Phytohabitans aurantiacus]|uniref:Vanomycin resistance protein VanB n=1 Tax=Phytohabitans aurantiacus TaxID=3016789 RepID=A0ABQ5RAG0_9ACTN|nr:vanomycin resistance protein VanB [Phytohabitans aurantiacus]